MEVSMLQSAVASTFVYSRENKSYPQTVCLSCGNKAASEQGLPPLNQRRKTDKGKGDKPHLNTCWVCKRIAKVYSTGDFGYPKLTIHNSFIKANPVRPNWEELSNLIPFNQKKKASEELFKLLLVINVLEKPETMSELINKYLGDKPLLSFYHVCNKFIENKYLRNKILNIWDNVLVEHNPIIFNRVNSIDELEKIAIATILELIDDKMLLFKINNSDKYKKYLTTKMNNLSTSIH